MVSAASAAGFLGLLVVNSKKVGILKTFTKSTWQIIAFRNFKYQTKHQVFRWVALALKGKFLQWESSGELGLNLHFGNEKGVLSKAVPKIINSSRDFEWALLTKHVMFDLWSTFFLSYHTHLLWDTCQFSFSEGLAPARLEAMLVAKLGLKSSNII